MKRAIGTAAALAVAVLAAGCGGGESGEGEPTTSAPSDPAAVERTWSGFVADVRKGDGAGACAALSTNLAEGDMVKEQLGSAEPADADTCDEVLGDETATLNFLAGAGDELVDVSIDGATASGTAGAAQPTFAGEDGEWRITSFYGVPSE